MRLLFGTADNEEIIYIIKFEKCITSTTRGISKLRTKAKSHVIFARRIHCILLIYQTSTPDASLHRTVLSDIYIRSDIMDNFLM